MKKKHAFTFVLALIFVTAIPLLLWWHKFGLGFGGTENTWANFGAFFGGVAGPIVAGLSVVGLLITIRMQSKNNLEQAQANREAEDFRIKTLESQLALEEAQHKRFETRLQVDTQLAVVERIHALVDNVSAQYDNLLMFDVSDHGVPNAYFRFARTVGVLSDLIPDDLGRYHKSYREPCLHAIATVCVMSKDVHRRYGKELSKPELKQTILMSLIDRITKKVSVP